MKKITLLLGLSLIAASAQAVTIAYSAQGTTDRPVTSTGAFLPDGALVRLGTFSAAFDFSANAANLSALEAAFTQFDTTAIFTRGGTRPGSFNKNTGQTVVDGLSVDNLKGISGTQLYLWIFNASTAAGSSEWGIFTNTTSAEWTARNETFPTNSNAFTLADVGLIAKVGTTFVSGAQTTGKLAVAVPEPSTYALMGLGLVVVGFMARRRK